MRRGRARPLPPSDGRGGAAGGGGDRPGGAGNGYRRRPASARSGAGPGRQGGLRQGLSGRAQDLRQGYPHRGSERGEGGGTASRLSPSLGLRATVLFSQPASRCPCTSSPGGAQFDHLLRLEGNVSIREELAEVVGTFTLVFIGAGAGAVAAASSSGGGLVGVALAHGLALVVIIYAWGAISGAHVNPAVTFGLALTGRFPWLRALRYWVAQLLGGALAGYLLLFLIGPQGNLGMTLPAPSVPVGP